MATRYWLGVNSNLTDTANWSATRLGAGGSSVPGAGDTAWFYDNSTDVLTNITNFLADVVNIGGNFRGNIGGATSGLELGTAACVCTIENVGKDYINILAKSATSIATVNIKAFNRGIVNLGGAGTFTNVYVGAAGRVTIDSAVTVTNYYGAGAVTEARTGTAFTILQLSGQPIQAHTITRGFTTGTFSNTSVVYNGTATITTVNVQSGAFYLHNSDQTITTCNAFSGGTAAAGAFKFTVTNLAQWTGAAAFVSRDMVTVTNQSYIGNPSGGVTPA
jgi:hypothetical protein